MASEIRWIVWWMLDDPHDVPVPHECGFTSLAEAVRWCGEQLKDEPQGIEWVKLFPAGDEADVRLRWSREALFHELSPTARDVLAEMGQVPLEPRS